MTGGQVTPRHAQDIGEKIEAVPKADHASPNPPTQPAEAIVEVVSWSMIRGQDQPQRQHPSPLNFSPAKSFLTHRFILTNSVVPETRSNGLRQNFAAPLGFREIHQFSI
jgi:hypothetical protein